MVGIRIKAQLCQGERSAGRDQVALSELLTRVIGFLRAGYPEGVPAVDRIPLLALLRRRLSDDEVLDVATELAASGRLPIDATDIRVAITRLTDELPTPADIDRVKGRLSAAGWTVNDQFDRPS
jgi:hypothetical protein